MPEGQPTEREFLEGLRYEDKFPGTYKGPQRDRTRAREDARSQAFEDGVARRLEDGLSDAMARDMTCWDCGHATGDHRAVRRPMPLANVFGVCLVDGCGCPAFQGAPG